MKPNLASSLPVEPIHNIDLVFVHSFIKRVEILLYKKVRKLSFFPGTEDKVEFKDNALACPTFLNDLFPIILLCK